MHDLVIIGGGPAGVAAGVYAARKRLKTVLVTEEVGGQSMVSEGIANWIGTTDISGARLAETFRTHLEQVAGGTLELVVGDMVNSLSKTPEGFHVTTRAAKEFDTKTVLVATGAGRRKLTIPGADKFENKGVTYCASCDGPLFSDMDVVVIGGGNAGFETAAQLLAYTKSVTLIHHHKEFKADPITVEKVSAHPHMKVLRHAEPIEVLGDTFVTGLSYKDKDSGEIRELKVGGIFVEAGVIPNTGFVEGVIACDQFKRIKTDPRNQRTNVEGIWAAGDCTDELYHQNNIAAGDGVKALEDIYLWIKMQ